MLFAGGRAAAALLREPDELIVGRFFADLHELYPQTRGVIAGATVRRWRLGNVYAAPAGAAYRRVAASAFARRSLNVQSSSRREIADAQMRCLHRHSCSERAGPQSVCAHCFRAFSKSSHVAIAKITAKKHKRTAIPLNTVKHKAATTPKNPS